MVVSVLPTWGAKSKIQKRNFLKFSNRQIESRFALLCLNVFIMNYEIHVFIQRLDQTRNIP